MTPTSTYCRWPAQAAVMTSKLLLAGLLWVVSLLLLAMVNVAGAASYDTLPSGLLLLEVSWALLQVLSLLRLIYCL